VAPVLGCLRRRQADLWGGCAANGFSTYRRMKVVAMTRLKGGEQNLVRTVVGLLAALSAATFLLAVLLHLGVRIPLGFAVLDEPQRPFAVIVEGLAGLLLTLGGVAILTRKTWAWAAATWGYAVALAGVVWGMVAVAAGRGPHTQLNDTFHRVMAVLLAAGLILLLTPRGRASLGRKRGAGSSREPIGRDELRLLLEGRPGAGKTTVARRLVELLRAGGMEVSGFTTEELREGRRRVGFAVESVSGDRAVMAHVDLPGPPRVGKYGIDLPGFERVALPALAARGRVVVIDELGKMELASEAFRHAVTVAFEGKAPVVATVHRFRHPFTDALRRIPGVEIIPISERTRGQLPGELATRLLSS
jgi:nucleoside-triphosphatase